MKSKLYIIALVSILLAPSVPLLASPLPIFNSGRYYCTTQLKDWHGSILKNAHGQMRCVNISRSKRILIMKIDGNLTTIKFTPSKTYIYSSSSPQTTSKGKWKQTYTSIETTAHFSDGSLNKGVFAFDASRWQIRGYLRPEKGLTLFFFARKR